MKVSFAFLLVISALLLKIMLCILIKKKEGIGIGGMG